ncbi:MAG TPA: ABC transporter permease [Candidatus Acidoferrum sp.]|jgi:predicted permease
MKLLSSLRSLISTLFHHDHIESEMEEELRLHIENRADDLERSGLSRTEAVRQARIEFGGQERFKEEIRDERASRWLETLWTDLRYAARMLRKSPGFTAVALLTLALGIGANTAIFTMMNGLMLHTLPVRDPARLVEILHHYPDEPEPGFNGFLWDDYQAMRGNRVLSDLIIGSLNFCVLSGHGFASQTAFVGNVGGTFFESLGVKPAIGRLIIPQDITDSAPVAVVSWSFWKSRFNLNPAIVGQKIIADDKPLTIVGVAQREFYGLSNQAKQDLWMPFSLGGPISSETGVGLYGYLNPGVTIQQARADLSTLFQASNNRPGADPFMRRSDLRVVPAGHGISTPVTQMLSTPLIVLMATVSLLLLLACANLAGLLMARGASRQHEMAVRVSLGAARSRLLRQNLTESLLLSIIGSAIGIFFAYAATGALVRVFASGRFITDLPVRFDMLRNPDARVLVFTAAIALLTGLLCGLAPAISASNVSPASALLPSAKIGQTKRQRFFGRGLVAAQVALSLVLVSLACLFVSYLSTLRNDLGFERNNLLLVTLDFAQSGYNPAQYSHLSQVLLARLNAVPGVSSATFSEMSPMEGPAASAVAVPEGHPEKQPQIVINNIAPGYFKTYATPFLAGRDFSSRDEVGSRVAIINQTAARDFFGTENPIGKHFTLDHITQTKEPKTFEVIGVVADAKYKDLEQPAPPTIYGNLIREGELGSQLAIRTKLDPASVDAVVRQTESDVFKNVPIVRMMEMNQQIDSTIVPQRLFAALSASFGALGVLLAVVGLYGLLAYAVARRTHEIGVRIALGAERTDVVRIVLRDAVWMICAGLAIGAPLAFWGKRIAASLIPGLPIAGALPIIVAAAVMIAVGLIAAYLPARRAMHVDPLIALRYE